ncbi:MAG: hypothetical protein J6334_04685 [Kiritimatiellae bacterium]|nr:hypothetical protein [Kiritimatiellia bacterium]
MFKRARSQIGFVLFVLSLLLGLPLSFPRTGELFTDTRRSLAGPDILINGLTWGSSQERDLLSFFIGSAFTLKLVLFSWWWDMLCIPYDFYLLKSDGVNFYVYDQDGNPIPDVEISGFGELSDSFFSEKTDTHGHACFPRRERGFNWLKADKEGYFAYVHNSSFWLRSDNNNELPPMLRPEYCGRTVSIGTTNNSRTVNLYLKKIPDRLQQVVVHDVVLSNLVSGVEYELDLGNAGLWQRQDNVAMGDIRLLLNEKEDSSVGRGDGCLRVTGGRSSVIVLPEDGYDQHSNSWPYIYYAPPDSLFERSRVVDEKMSPLLIRMDDSGRSKYAFVTWRGMGYSHNPWRVYLRYWMMTPSDDGVIVCDYWGRKERKTIVPKAKP